MRPLQCRWAVPASFSVAHRIIGFDQPQVRQRVRVVGIEAGRDDKYVGAEIMQGRQDARFERLAEPLAAIAGPQGRIVDIADTALARRPGAGKQRHLVRRAVKQVLVGPEDILCAVAVVNIEIDDGDALGAVLGAGVEPGDGGVGEQAEAHGAVGLGVMAGRAHLAEGVGGFAADDGVDRGETGADGAQRCLPGAGGHDGVAVDVARVLERARRNGAHFFQMRLRVREQDLLLDILAQRRLGALQAVEHLMRQHLVDGAHAVGALGVPGAGVVLSEGRVRQKECRHGCACRILIVGRTCRAAMLPRAARKVPERSPSARVLLQNEAS